MNLEFLKGYDPWILNYLISEKEWLSKVQNSLQIWICQFLLRLFFSYETYFGPQINFSLWTSYCWQAGITFA